MDTTEPTETDRDVRELAEYFLEKSGIVIGEHIALLDKQIAGAAKLEDALSSNDSLSWRCGIRRCLDGAGEKCRACQAHHLATQLLQKLKELRTERQLAARAAESMKEEARRRRGN